MTRTALPLVPASGRRSPKEPDLPAAASYPDLLALNAWIRKNSDTWYFHCATRTVQESKLFPTPGYMTLSYLQAYYRYPTLLRKLAEVITPEMLGDRLREVTTKGNIISLSCIPQFYLAGRQLLIGMGMLRPTDGIDDLVFVEDFARRLNLAYHRQHAHVLPSDAGLRAQLLPERRLQLFEGDAIGMAPGDRLHVALQKFLATANQYSFLSHCESRLGIHNNGPYKTAGGNEMLVRGFADLGEGDLSWLDGIAAGVTNNNLTIPVIVKDTRFTVVDDWASFEATPGYDHDNVVAVGLYTSDYLSEGEFPVAMDNAATLADFFDHESQILRTATRDLWREAAGWSRDQMLDAGAMIYAGVAKDLFHVAGVYEQDDWFTIDPRADRIRPLLNDEYARDFIAELLGLVSLPSQQGSPYAMSKHANTRGDMWSLVPYSVLVDDEFTPTAGSAPTEGVTHLDSKTAGWNTTRGPLSLDEYNTLAREFTPKFCQEPYRFLDDTWVKWHGDTELSDQLYRLDQRADGSLGADGCSSRT